MSNDFSRDTPVTIAVVTDNRRLRNKPVERAFGLAGAPSGFDVDSVPRMFNRDQLAELVASGSLPDVIEMARETERGARAVRLWLESLTAEEERRCGYCGGPVVGRADRVYCSSRCRQAAHRVLPPGGGER